MSVILRLLCLCSKKFVCYRPVVSNIRPGDQNRPSEDSFGKCGGHFKLWTLNCIFTSLETPLILKLLQGHHSPQIHAGVVEGLKPQASMQGSSETELSDLSEPKKNCQIGEDACGHKKNEEQI